MVVFDVSQNVFERFGCFLPNIIACGVAHTGRSDVANNGAGAFGTRLGCGIVAARDRELHIRRNEITLTVRT